jgi:CRISPR-associated protein Cas1
MRELLNTLYVQTPGTVLHLDHDAVLARHEGEPVGRVPLRRIMGIAVIGRVSVTPSLIHRCAGDGVSISWFSQRGRHSGTLRGRTSGNVLLRLAQYRHHDDEHARLELARTIVAGKLLNAARFARHAAHLADNAAPSSDLRAAAATLDKARRNLPDAASLDAVRGVEGAGTRAHFDNIRLALRREGQFNTRTRRPPLSPFNAVLSFLYALARQRIEHACDAVGLDPQVGYLHSVRPGRPALALDLLEEHRPIIDQLCVTLSNRRQLPERCFDVSPGGAVALSEDGRKVVLTAWTTYLENEVRHRALRESVPAGLLFPVQATVLARHIRGDLPHYLPHAMEPD